MLEQTKKQKEALQRAIDIISRYPEKLQTDEWQNLWNESYNNRNALFMGLLDYMEGRPYFCKCVITNETYIHDNLVRFAKMIKGYDNVLTNELSDLLCDLSESIGKLKEKAEEIEKDILYHKKVFNNADFDNLNTYYINAIPDPDKISESIIWD